MSDALKRIKNELATTDTDKNDQFHKDLVTVTSELEQALAAIADYGLSHRFNCAAIRYSVTLAECDCGKLDAEMRILGAKEDDNEQMDTNC